jgi:lipopolysaccharide/colanic/teichoic acid biosynthesis glycosyltransferase
MSPSPSPRRPFRTSRRPPRVLDAPIFRSVLIRERKRAERSDRPTALVVVAAPHRHRAPEPGWPTVIERLAAAMDRTDVIGWHDPGVVIGIIRPVASAPDVLRLRAALEDVARVCAVRVLIHPEPVSRSGENLRAVDLALYPELAFPRRADRLRDAAKRALDLVSSLVLLAPLAPVLVTIAALVKLTSPGPAFFGQTRVGHRRTPFTMFKFRTMHAQSDPTVHREFVGQFIAAGGRNGRPDAFFKLTNDPRITPLGRFLRKTSLDELPQLWNVLRGDMSLVGPRPPVPYEYAQYRPWHRRRVIEVKPGMTGLWQVTGRSRTTFDEMVRLDLHYARTRSFWGDLAIIGRTPPAVISGKGAC